MTIRNLELESLGIVTVPATKICAFVGGIDVFTHLGLSGKVTLQSVNNDQHKLNRKEDISLTEQHNAK
jgi:hypothetical protein